MTIPVDVWLRGEDVATTTSIDDMAREPAAWNDDDVRQVLEAMLGLMHGLKHPGDIPKTVQLRGLSWIVNPFEGGGVVIALEITMGAAIAGPIAIDKTSLEAMITRVLRPQTPPTTTIH